MAKSKKPLCPISKNDDCSDIFSHGYRWNT